VTANDSNRAFQARNTRGSGREGVLAELAGVVEVKRST
jgi:hypothetical protein